MIRGEPRRPFRYRDLGTLATIGRGAAVCNFGRVHLTGAVGWLAWLAVHLYLMSGLENRLLVLFQWAWSFFTFQRSARLITQPWRPAAA
jgi:NADH dehydrogenase